MNLMNDELQIYPRIDGSGKIPGAGIKGNENFRGSTWGFGPKTERPGECA
jgi:hypothetical protein